ncbi:alkane hydroxylase MAH1-like [Euphorbia lathyris]|uniref:alkane hydroxylase MAH1-like n=1 Tax=Euphorbia lathyris TaxID=212925 RepID=UPI0033144520
MTRLDYVYVGAIILSILVWIFWSNRWKKNYGMKLPKAIRKIPGFSSSVYNFHEMTTRLLRKNGCTFRFKGPWFSGMDFLMTCDPINLNYFLNTNFTNYHKGNDFRDMFEPLRDGILAADSDNWRNQRRIVHSLFLDKRFKASIERTLHHKISNALFSLLENASNSGNVVDLQDIFQRLTFDNICLIIFGFDPNCLSLDFPQVAIQTAFHEMQVAVLYRHLLPSTIWKLQRFLQIGKEKSFRKAWKVVDQFVALHISKERHKLLTHLETDFNVLTYFLTSIADEENGIRIKSDRFLSDMAFNLLTAGRDTIASALVWFFWVVGTHPSVENKILEEMKANLQTESNGKRSTSFKFEELNKLIYLHAVICEVLRLYPSLPFNHIVSIDEDTLPSGHHIPKNLMVLYSLYSTGRMEQIWGKDCLEFKPERWISKKGEIVHVPSYKYITFNAGPRSCLGKNLTFIQVKAIASAILWNYCIQVVQNYPAQPTTSVVLYMRNGFKIRLSKRFAS